MYILGVDLGTTSMTALVYEKNNGIIYKTSSSYKLYTGNHGESEQNPQDWLIAFNQIINDCLHSVTDFGYKLKAISVSGQMHSLVCISKENKIIRPAILWNDTRTSQEVKQINKHHELINQETQNKALDGFTLPKLLWLREHEKENYESIDKILLPKDYLNYYLTGKKFIEETDAAGTIMYNLQEKSWSKKILDRFAIDESILPPVVRTGDKIGFIRPELAKSLSLSKETLIFAGAADNVASALGVGVFDETTSMLSLGTSGVYLTIEPNFKYNDGDVHFFSYANDLYYSMGVTLAAGKSLAWFKDVFYKNISYDDMLSQINQSPVGANKLLFTPYIQGERTPYTDSNIRGSFIGLDINTTSEDMIRAVIEGITFSLKDCQQIMFNKKEWLPQNLVVTGGGARSKEWLQIIANVMNQNVCRVRVEEGAALGSIIIALVSLGIFENYEKAYESLNGVVEIFTPNNKDVKKYRHLFNIYQNVYKSTKNISADLRGLDL